MGIRQGAVEDLGVTSWTDLSPSFWRGKRILLTGHTGFKGSWLALWLNYLGAETVGVSIPPTTTPNLYSLAKVEKLCQSHVSYLNSLMHEADLSTGVTLYDFASSWGSRTCRGVFWINCSQQW